MGCLASVQVFPSRAITDNGKMGSAANIYTVGKGKNTLVQKKQLQLPLTEREVFAISKSWKTISRNMTSTGIAMFLR